MPSQVIVLPTAVLDAIIDHRGSLQIALGSRHMRRRRFPRRNSMRILRVEIDRPVFCPELPNGLNDDIPAILLTSNASTPELVLPVPLPDATAHHILDEVEAALTNLPPPHWSRQAGDRFEHCRVANSSADSAAPPRTGRAPMRMRPSAWSVPQDLQAALQPALTRIDRRLSHYGAWCAPMDSRLPLFASGCRPTSVRP